MLKLNEASWDRIARFVLGIVLLVLGWFNVVPGGWGVFLKIISFIPLITGLVGWCPIYSIFKTGTKKN